MKTKKILGGEITKGSVVYEVDFITKEVKQYRVLDLVPTEWNMEVYDVALDDGYTRKNGAARSLCKTKELANKYMLVLQSGDNETLERFVNGNYGR